MESARKNLQDLTNIPESEFKEHFREWMEQDHVARSLQAKLRKDLISNFNKTTLGKNIIAQTALSNRLTLSPLILALNTLVAEFLYAENCHFTLSVFCTEVPYRNTLPDFESVRRFRFNKREIFEIFNALCSHWEERTKDDIFKEYSKQNCSLLFYVLKGLLKQPNESATTDNRVTNVEPTMPKGTSKELPPPKLESKTENQNNNFRYLNKYLIILSKKVKEMSQNMKQLEKQKSGPQAERKSIQARRFENLNRSLARISENLKQMSVSKRKNRKLTAVVTAINAMSKQFERCVMNFDHISKGLGQARTEKSYSDWIKEMRSTNNGKRFLEKIESALRKCLHKEKDKMEQELEQRLQIQKDILKTKYKQKLAEELGKHTSRSAAENTLKANESFEKKLSEYETKHQELHQRIHETERKVLEAPMSRFANTAPLIDNKCTQTATAPKPEKIQVDTHKELHQMVKTISEQERQFDHIVFDAKLRIQELEHESNQLDRTFRDYLERQNSEKEKLRETATSIWQSYALGKSMLDRKYSVLHSTSRTMEKLPAASTHILKTRTKPAPTIPRINIEMSTSTLNPSSTLFENPFRTAQKKVLTRSKTLPQPAVSTDTESSDGDKHPRHQRPSVLGLIEHCDKKASETQTSRHSPTTVALLSPELNIKDITLDGIEISTTTAKSSTPRSNDSNGSSTSPRGVFKLRRQLFTATDNGGPSRSTNGRQMNSNGNKEAEEPLKQINGENTDIGAPRKPIDVQKKDVDVNKENRDGDGNSKEHSTEPRGVKILDAPLPIDEKDAS